MEMNEFIRNLKSDGKRALPYIVLAAILDFGERLIEHRILAAVNDFIDAHSGWFLAFIKPVLVWLVQTPFVLLMGTICIILLHTYFTRDYAAPSTSSDPRSFPADTPSSVVPPVQAQPAADLVRANIVLRGVSVVLTDTIHEYYPPDKRGAVGVKACFLNQRLAGRATAQFSYVTASVAYGDRNKLEVAYTDSPKWLRHEVDDAVSINPNTSECLLLAIWDHSGEWVLPYLEPMTYDDGSPGKELNIRPLPFGTLSIEITLASEDSDRPHFFVVNLNLSPDARVTVLA
jgi:hypothetical protein